VGPHSRAGHGEERTISAPSRSLHLILCLAVAQVISNRSVIARCRLDIMPVCARFLVSRMALGVALCSVLFTKYYLDDQTKNEMDGACGNYVGSERCMLAVGGETSEKETTWKT